MRPVSPHAVKAMLADGGELALIDVREELIYSQNHLLWARSVPLSRLELRFARLVPRLGTRIVLCDDGDGLVERAAEVLSVAGYTDLSYLEGGVAGWQKEGFELFSGVHVPSKAFGEFIEHTCETPNIGADELHGLIRDDANIVVLDSRPFDEYRRVSIPTSINVPGAELVLRVRDMAPSPETTVVVNCAGRTRSIIGAQSVINAGVPNKVVALRNGTMGWSLAGFTPDHGKDKRAPSVSDGSLAWAKEAAARVAERYGIQSIDLDTLGHWRTDKSRTSYLFDVRDPPEYATGHVPGAISAPGGQLVQATDLYAGTLGARIVLVDDAVVRAVMTASWLKQMGWKDVFVLTASGSEVAAPKTPLLGGTPSPEAGIDCKHLSALLESNQATVIDLSPSPSYRTAHIPGAWFAIRSRLKSALPRIPVQGELVLTSEDGVLAGLTASEAAVLVGKPARHLVGGNAAWQAAGYPMSEEPRIADDPVDVWLKPYERAGDTRAAMDEYLAWEVDLLPRLERDGTCDFHRFRK